MGGGHVTTHEAAQAVAGGGCGRGYPHPVWSVEAKATMTSTITSLRSLVEKLFQPILLNGAARTGRENEGAPPNVILPGRGMCLQISGGGDR